MKGGSREIGKEDFFSQLPDYPTMNVASDVFAVLLDQPMTLALIFPEFSAQPLRDFVAGRCRREKIIAAPNYKQRTSQ